MKEEDILTRKVAELGDIFWKGTREYEHVLGQFRPSNFYTLSVLFLP